MPEQPYESPPRNQTYSETIENRNGQRVILPQGTNLYWSPAHPDRYIRPPGYTYRPRSFLAVVVHRPGEDVPGALGNPYGPPSTPRYFQQYVWKRLPNGRIETIDGLWQSDAANMHRPASYHYYINGTGDIYQCVDESWACQGTRSSRETADSLPPWNRKFVLGAMNDCAIHVSIRDAGGLAVSYHEGSPQYEAFCYLMVDLWYRKQLLVMDSNYVLTHSELEVGGRRSHDPGPAFDRAAVLRDINSRIDMPDVRNHYGLSELPVGVLGHSGRPSTTREHRNVEQMLRLQKVGGSDYSPSFASAAVASSQAAAPVFNLSAASTIQLGTKDGSCPPANIEVNV